VVNILPGPVIFARMMYIFEVYFYCPINDRRFISYYSIGSLAGEQVAGGLPVQCDCTAYFDAWSKSSGLDHYIPF